MTTTTAAHAADLVAALLFILSLAGLSQHRTSRAGVVYGIAGMALALVATVVLASRSITAGAVALIVVAMALGAVIGLWRARQVEMTQMPELIAVLHSFVGLAAVLVGWNSYLEVESRGSAQVAVAADLLRIHHAEVVIGIFIGAVTFTGSVVAFLKLSGRLTSFVGREDDLGALRTALAGSRLVTLTGPGGSGKTRLSIEAGRVEQAAGHWPDGVWLAELAPLESPLAVPAAVVSALGLRETLLHTGSLVAEALESRAEDPLRRLVEYCGHRRMLLVLDNCEHLIQAAADLTDQLLAECPGLTVLATSREPLG
ncbi:NAD(P)(+) transhydrogenase (Re/Si-specific) subunit beta, partial [Kitasatospora sp. NPDC058263]